MPTSRKFKAATVPPAGEQSESKYRLCSERGNTMRLGYFAAACLSIAISGIDVGDAIAQDVVKIGLVIPMTGGFTSVGREVAAGAKLYIQQDGETVAGRKVELIIRDDASVPDAGKRLAQELIVKDKVSFLGAGITPTAMAMAPLVTEAKVATGDDFGDLGGN